MSQELVGKMVACLEGGPDGFNSKARRGGRGASPRVRVDPELMVPRLQSQDRMGAIKELVDRMYLTGYVRDSLSFLQAVLDREDLESTVIETGVAFPHARCRSATQLGMAFGISPGGVDFHSDVYPQEVNLVCLMAVPVVGEEGYLPLLAGLSGLFQDRTFRMGFLGCDTPQDMYRFLIERELQQN